MEIESIVQFGHLIQQCLMLILTTLVLKQQALLVMRLDILITNSLFIKLFELSE